MDIRATLVANHQTPEAMKPCEIAFGHPPIATQPLTGFDTFACDARRDAACT